MAPCPQQSAYATYPQVRPPHQEGQAVIVDATAKIQQLANKWRAERNFWLAFQAFIFWCILARLYQVMVDKVQLEEELVRAKRGNGVGSPVPPTSAGGASASVTRKHD